MSDEGSAIDRIAALNDRVVELHAQGRPGEAIELAEEAARLAREALGPRHQATATMVHNLASMHQVTGDHATAEPLYREALEIRREVLGPRHHDVAETLNNLAFLLKEMGEYVEAEALYREGL